MADIDVNYLSEAINDKMDRDAHNVQSPSAVVIAKQDPTAENGYTWYRLYSDGWVEQGGQTSGTGETVNVTLPIEMADANFGGFVSYLVAINSSEWTSYVNGFSNRTTTTIRYNSKSGLLRSWQVSGKSKQN